jgi:orotidine-5'-phosphate decarboxylase
MLCEHCSDEDAILSFNKTIIDATADYAVAFKPNLAFYEALGPKGLEVFERTIRYIQERYPDQFIIADAKRGDIGNTSKMYAKAFFEYYNIDAITVAPYMGEDSVKPFFGYPDKWVILLALTSNEGSEDFQLMENFDVERLYEVVLQTAQKWASIEELMFVIGATQASELTNIRKIVPNHFLLVPGVGAQGGSLEEVSKFGMNDQCGLLVNSSRQILYASRGEDFAEAARETAKQLQTRMEKQLFHKGLITYF